MLRKEIRDKGGSEGLPSALVEVRKGNQACYSASPLGGCPAQLAPWCVTALRDSKAAAMLKGTASKTAEELGAGMNSRE